MPSFGAPLSNSSKFQRLVVLPSFAIPLDFLFNTMTSQLKKLKVIQKNTNQLLIPCLMLKKMESVGSDSPNLEKYIYQTSASSV